MAEAFALKRTAMEAKREQLRMQRELEELQKCTFRPQIHPSPTGVYRRGPKEERFAIFQREEEEQTFHPQLAPKSQRLAAKKNAGRPVIERLLDAGRQHKEKLQESADLYALQEAATVIGRPTLSSRTTQIATARNREGEYSDVFAKLYSEQAQPCRRATTEQASVHAAFEAMMLHSTSPNRRTSRGSEASHSRSPTRNRSPVRAPQTPQSRQQQQQQQQQQQFPSTATRNNSAVKRPSSSRGSRVREFETDGPLRLATPKRTGATTAAQAKSRQDSAALRPKTSPAVSSSRSEEDLRHASPSRIPTPRRSTSASSSSYDHNRAVAERDHQIAMLLEQNASLVRTVTELQQALTSAVQ